MRNFAVSPFAGKIALALFLAFSTIIDVWGQSTSLFSTLTLSDNQLTSGQLALKQNYEQRQTTASIQLVDLADASQIQQSIRLDLYLPYDPTKYTFTVTTLEAHPNGEFYWYGILTETSECSEAVLEDDCLSGYLSIIGKNNQVFGEMRIDTSSYQIPYLGSGMNGLVKLKPTEGPVCVSNDDPPQIAGPAQAEERDICPVVRLLILYSQSAINDFPDIQNISTQSYFNTKQALHNSAILVTNLDLQLVGIELLPNFVPTGDFEIDKMTVLESNSNARQLRDLYQADLVFIMTPNVYDQFAGAVFSFGDGPSDGNTAFSFVEASFANAPDFTFSHEFGHLFGARHQNTANCGTNHDDSGLPHAHAFAFEKGCACFIFNNKKFFKTVVSPCDDNAQRITILHYSNPDVNFKNKSTGTESTNNNARVIREATCRVSSYIGSKDISVSISAPSYYVCPGSTFTAIGSINGAFGPYQYEWRYKIGPAGAWSPIIYTTPQNQLTLTVPNGFFGIIYIELTGTNGTEQETYSVGVLSDYLNCPHFKPVEPTIVSSNSLQISPNPAISYVTLQLREPVAGNIDIMVTNLLGKPYISKSINTGEASSDQFTLDLPNLPDGQYMVSLRSANFRQIAQFTVLR